MELIEQKTGWLPSAGSIYPLFGRLNEMGTIRPVKTDDPNLKSYKITKEGQELLEEHKERKSLFREKYQSMMKTWLRMYEEWNEELFEAFLE